MTLFLLQVIFCAKILYRKTDSLWNSNNYGAWHTAQVDNIPMYSYCSSICIRPTSLNTQQTDEKNALISLYNALGGSNWIRSYGWLTGFPCYDLWYGIQCNPSGYVIRIYLPENKLRGTITTGILAKFTYLQVFHIGNLSIASSKSIKNPIYMTNRQNQVSGSLQDLSYLQYLDIIDITGNKFSSFPTSLTASANTLEYIGASWNTLVTFPSLSNLVNLRVLDLSNNLITASLPNWLCEIASIEYLNFGNNTAISGSIPTCVVTSLNPYVFDLSAVRPVGNGTLTGQFPSGIRTSWTNVADNGYISIYNQKQITGIIGELCSDMIHCFTHMYQTYLSYVWNTATISQTELQTVENAINN
jgi:hypothetical protein